MAESESAPIRIMAHADDAHAVAVLRVLLQTPPLVGEHRSVSFHRYHHDPSTGYESYLGNLYQHEAAVLNDERVLQMGYPYRRVAAEIVICRQFDNRPVDRLVVSSVSNPSGHFTTNRSRIGCCTPYTGCLNVSARYLLLVFGNLSTSNRHRLNGAAAKSRQKQILCAARQLITDTLAHPSLDTLRPVTIAELNEEHRRQSRQMPWQVRLERHLAW